MIPETKLDTYESITDYAREISEGLDERRWILGDLANMVSGHYGDNTIETFARDIGQRKSTVYQYAKVALYYPKILRRRILDEMPNINYSHMRDAMRCSDDFNDAWDWLKECSDNGWSADESSRRLTEQLGREPRETIEGNVSRKFSQEDGFYVIVKFENDVDIQMGQVVTLKVK